ncbi:NifB/NifX family molybdenum-iron cluster-binding protein [Agarivorans sp. 1_MG-2023]|uniref:NifB/NifX family molybdenum-iron cluster-binding protein n=1 Tax=Agarivorans sp. 1_MG-2023 TaxID=3062634 RepID=UPI0026E3E83E|nr:NifB/NifX family molybdenum-iron cluster-binding protein [Agarivorans sp. 1_MG-2023]MDO6762399.1 NifB/NifX family molybdenum-iron cluster-binding protein [Agarivorans sp. 1_MG-2023]
MIYAVANDQALVANHFSKAEQFSFFTHNNSLIANWENPAANAEASCIDKSAIITQLQTMKTEVVIVRNIGERALAKLLKAGIKVFQVGHKTEVKAATTSDLLELHHPSQGRASTQYNKNHHCEDRQQANRCCGQPNKRHNRSGRSGKACCS